MPRSFLVKKSERRTGASGYIRCIASSEDWITGREGCCASRFQCRLPLCCSDNDSSPIPALDICRFDAPEIPCVPSPLEYSNLRGNDLIKSVKLKTLK